MTLFVIMYAVLYKTAMVYPRARLCENIPNGYAFFNRKLYAFITQNLQAVVDILEGFTFKESVADKLLFLVVLVRLDVFQLNEVFI